MNDKEFAVAQEIFNNVLVDQRTISTKTGFSLGLTNLILKRLASKGYIKIRQLNGKKIQYILTSKGFKEKVKKSFNYTIKTIVLFNKIKKELENFVIEEYNSGKRNFVVKKNSELSEMIEIIIKSVNLEGINFIKINNENKVQKYLNDKDSIIINVVNDYNNLKNNKNVVDIIDYFEKRRLYFWK
jgi:DNA-binding PadR family transcriptional regulator